MNGRCGTEATETEASDAEETSRDESTGEQPGNLQITAVGAGDEFRPGRAVFR